MLFIASFNVIAHVPLRHVLVRYALVCHVSGHVSVRIPVSYTHLDVYKRQDFSSSLIGSVILAEI